MSFVGRSDAERREMLATIGVPREETLWDQIPKEFRLSGPLSLPAPLAEYEITRKFHEWAGLNADASRYASFLGGGIYDHFIPAALRSIVSRSEYATAYTPYQPEVAQGTLQAIWEFQTIVSELYGLPLANASLYDGASAAAEAVLMALHAGGKRTQIVVPSSLHPEYRQTIATYLESLDAEVKLLDCP